MNILGVKFKELLNVLLIALKEGCSREVNSGGAYEALSNCFAGDPPNKKVETSEITRSCTILQSEKKKPGLVLDSSGVNNA